MEEGEGKEGGNKRNGREVRREGDRWKEGRNE